MIYDVRLQELRLYTDYGRCSRPLFIVQDQSLLIQKQHIVELREHAQEPKPLFGWNELVKRGFVECACQPALCMMLSCTRAWKLMLGVPERCMRESSRPSTYAPHVLCSVQER